jgi:hypothetical protein
MDNLSDAFNQTVLKIGMDKLESPIFYNAPIGIRFEIGGQEPIYLSTSSEKLVSSTYLIDSHSTILFHLYDDRGLDVVAANKESLRSLYERFNVWILDYDRKKIDLLFKK